MRLSDQRWADLIEQRCNEPYAALDALRTRRRRPLLRDGRLFIVAADHTARGMLGVGDDMFVMADRRRMIDSLLIALEHPGVDGVLGSPDILEELALLGVLDDRLAFGTTNRGGLMGAQWELDDRPTAYAPADMADVGLDGGKMLLRIADDDAGTASTIEWAAKVVSECVRLQLPMMIEPLPYHHTAPVAPGTAKLLDDDDALLRAVAVGASLGFSGAATWLKVPASRNPGRLLSVTTLPALILGGAPGPDPEATYRSWEAAMRVPNVRGLVVGRALLYPADGDVAGAIGRAAHIVRPE
jgi:hypothetical protein